MPWVCHVDRVKECWEHINRNIKSTWANTTRVAYISHGMHWSFFKTPRPSSYTWWLPIFGRVIVQQLEVLYAWVMSSQFQMIMQIYYILLKQSGVRINFVALGHTVKNIHISVVTEFGQKILFKCQKLQFQQRFWPSMTRKIPYKINLHTCQVIVVCGVLAAILHYTWVLLSPFQDKTVGSTPQPLPNHAGFPPHCRETCRRLKRLVSSYKPQ